MKLTQKVVFSDAEIIIICPGVGGGHQPTDVGLTLDTFASSRGSWRNGPQRLRRAPVASGRPAAQAEATLAVRGMEPGDPRDIALEKCRDH